MNERLIGLKEFEGIEHINHPDNQLYCSISVLVDEEMVYPKSGYPQDAWDKEDIGKWNLLCGITINNEAEAELYASRMFPRHYKDKRLRFKYRTLPKKRYHVFD